MSPSREAQAASLPVAILLAGGRGTRMGGGDKPLRLLRGRALLDHVITRIRPQVAALALNANGDAARFAAWSLPVIPDTIPGHPGPLAGVLAGLCWTRAHHPGCRDMLAVPTDTPFLPLDLVARLAAARAGGQSLACAASAGRLHPVVALWPVALADTLDAALRAGGAHRVGEWMQAQGLAVADFGTEDGDPFLNVNTPVDLATSEQA